MAELWVVEVSERFSERLSSRGDRAYAAPAQPRDAALQLAAFLLDRDAVGEGDGPWQRALAGGRRTVRIVPA